jgi:hypothetical protein
MTAVKGKPATGITYSYTSSALPQGDDYFVLKFDDGSGLQTIQEYSIEVSPIILNQSSVSPASGTASTPFTFSTVYFGANPATVVDAIVDGQAHAMSLVSGSPATGATYSTTLTLPAGHHNFAFYVTDGTNYWGDPPNDATYSGLDVTAAGQPRMHSRIVRPRPDEAPYEYDAG